MKPGFLSSLLPIIDLISFDPLIEFDWFWMLLFIQRHLYWEAWSVYILIVIAMIAGADTGGVITKPHLATSRIG